MLFRSRVLSWEYYRPAKVDGPADYCYPAEGGEGEWEILDRKGRRAPWLERKMTDSQRSALEEEIFNHMENQNDDYYD